MLKKELYVFFKSRTQIIVMIVMIAIMLLDVYLAFQNSSLRHFMSEETSGYELEAKDINHPANRAFLSGSSRGHFPQYIIFYILPLFSLLLCSDNYILEYKKKYSQIMMTRTRRKSYVLAKYVTSFIIPACIMLLGTTINLILSMIIYNGGKSFNQAERILEETTDPFFTFMYTHPYYTYVFYMILAAIGAGMCSLMCRSIAFLTKKYQHAYFISFAVWMVLIILPYSVINIFQPFTEYGVRYIIVGFAILLAITGVTVWLSYRRLLTEDEM